MLLAQKRFAAENRKEGASSDRQKAQNCLSRMARDENELNRVNVYFAFLRSGVRPRPILPPLTVQVSKRHPSRSRNPRWFDQKLRNYGLRVRVQKDTVLHGLYYLARFVQSATEPRCSLTT